MKMRNTRYAIRNTQYETGFTLAEAMLATVILGIAAAGVLMPFVSGASVRAEGVRLTLGAKLASDLMQQIVNTDPDQIIASYDGYSEAQGQVKNISGTVFTDSRYTLFSRSASCVEVYVSGESGNFDPIFIRATVRVYYAGREISVLSRVIAK